MRRYHTSFMVHHTSSTTHLGRGRDLLGTGDGTHRILAAASLDAECGRGIVAVDDPRPLGVHVGVGEALRVGRPELGEEC